MSRIPVVEAEVKALVVVLVRLADKAYQFLRANTIRFGPEHNRRAVGVVGAHKTHRMPLHPLEWHPDIGREVLHDGSDVKRTVGAGRGSGDEERAARRGRKLSR